MVALSLWFYGKSQGQQTQKKVYLFSTTNSLCRLYRKHNVDCVGSSTGKLKPEEKHLLGIVMNLLDRLHLSPCPITVRDAEDVAATEHAVDARPTRRRLVATSIVDAHLVQRKKKQ